MGSVASLGLQDSVCVVRAAHTDSRFKVRSLIGCQTVSRDSERHPESPTHGTKEWAAKELAGILTSFILKWEKRQCPLFQDRKRAQTSANAQQLSNLLFSPNTSFLWLQFKPELISWLCKHPPRNENQAAISISFTLMAQINNSLMVELPGLDHHQNLIDFSLAWGQSAQQIYW